jgi:cardiolipin hydrolase
MRILLGTVIAAVVLSLARPHIQGLLNLEHSRIVAGARSGSLTPGETGAEEHFSPTENLEELDIKYLCQARESVDVAMFAFTDQRIAETLKQLAVGHVKIRIYRDQGQFREEEDKAARVRALPTSILLRGSVNIQIRVKQGPERDFMHEKVWCLDHRLLRDGSANWSPGGEMTQDNQIHITTDPQLIAGFERTFEEMWSRPSNRVIQ